MQFTILLALAPAFGLLWMYQRMDAKRPEPPASVRNIVLLGVASAVPAVIVELVVTKLLGDSAVNAGGKFLNAFLIAATTEECMKLACVLLYLWRKPHFDEVMDGILYTAAASLGFAMIENVLYVGSNLTIAIVRAISAVPMHALCSGLMGYFVGRGKLARDGAAGWVLGGLAVGIAIHGAYDWALMSEGGFGMFPPSGLVGFLIALGLVVISAVLMRFAYKHALFLDDAILGPHSRPLQLAAVPQAAVAYQAPQPYVGMPVMVQWSDGNVYPASLVSGQGNHFLCAMAGGRQEWFPRECVRPA